MLNYYGSWKRGICFVALASALCLSSPALAVTIIDSFVTPFDVSGEPGWNGTNANAVGPRSGVTTLTQAGAAGAIGDRTATFTGDNSLNSLVILSGFTIDTAGNFVAAGGQGVLTVNTNTLSVAYSLDISYDVTDLDLSLENRFRFNFQGDLDTRIPAATLPFEIELTSGAVTDTAGVTLSADGGPYEILFSAFSGIDFSDIDGIRLLSSDGVSSPDFGISQVLAVPEPSTALLLGVGLVGLARGRRQS